MNQNVTLIKFDKGEISSTSIVNDYVKLGSGSKIWHFCNVYGTKEGPIIIGDDTNIGSHSEIRPNVKIGDHCRFQHNLCISDHVSIGNYVFVGANVTFLNDKYPTAHKSINRALEKLSPAKVMDHTSIGSNSSIGPGVTVGQYCVVAMGSMVTRDVSDYSVVAGNPAKVIGKIYDSLFIEHFPEFHHLKRN